MPYIKQERRKELDPAIEALVEALLNSNSKPVVHMMNEGDCNYVISKIMHGFIASSGVKYKNLNAAVGVLECAKAEFIRMVVSPYEDIKIQENGPVSDLDRKDACCDQLE